MAVFRVQKNKDYTVMSNTHLRDIRLTLKAKGLLSLMLSLPDGWDYSLKGLSNICREKVDAIREAVKELESAGYVVRSRERDEKGRLLGACYDVIESPEKPILDFPTLDKPTQEKPTLGNPTQLNTDISNTEPSNTEEEIPPTPPVQTSEKERRQSCLTKAQKELFDRFWEAYPRKVAKGYAEKVWQKLGATPELASEIVSGVQRAIQNDSRFRDIQYTPHPSTWLNGREWENRYDNFAGGSNGAFRPSTGVRTDF